VSDQLALANAIEDAGIERGKAELLAAMHSATTGRGAATTLFVEASQALDRRN
jgi:hypothetical protein